ncbi:MAG: HlyD family efflux transporter periplasmic adaptor subunit [Bacteroidota bacterium]|nr:HlyD family efflux transporter periplasmic adaptor subunit [Bacteroidota bacterium]MDP4227401.1 HlyD family efflux transporter periplasmic adaptor subunit [Bacteroidota bacterium]
MMKKNRKMKTYNPQKFKIPLLIITLLCFFVSGCKQKPSSDPDDEAGKNMDAKTPVTVAHISFEPMAETLNLNAVSAFLQKNTVRSTVAGVIENVSIRPGEMVRKGELLFTIQTKEASALSHLRTYSDSSFRFKGLIRIRASRSGIVSSVKYQHGDYVQEGDELAIISDQKSLVFILELPFELRPYVRKGGSCSIFLADHSILKGTVSSNLPVMDIQSQTEQTIIKPTGGKNLPENLIARIEIVKSLKPRTAVLPKSAILSDETQSQFWVMKLINDSTAIKIPVSKGIENSQKVEILQPSFSSSDKIVVSGNYGLSDTAKILIKKILR